MSITTKFIGTANHGFAQQAQEEIRRLFPDIKFSLLVPTELFLFETEAERETVISVLTEQEPIFLRHMHPVDAEWELTRTELDLQHVTEWLKQNGALANGEKTAIQVRKEEKAQVPYASFTIKSAIEEAVISCFQAEPVVRAADRIISVYVSSNRLFVGLSKPADNLSDWPGGAIRFHKEEDQISRAKFKLLEAEQRFRLDFSEFRSALDIGAAPGGWTSFLLEKGLEVTAIDPASMHPRLQGHPRLTIHKKNAGEVKLREQQFDLLVCDMSWSPRQMGRLVADLLHALRSGGTAIITVKLMHKKAFQTVRELLAAFEPELYLVKAKQLFHNREELTLYLRKS